MFLHGYDPGLYQLRYRGTGTVDVRMTPGWQGDIYIVPGTMHTEGDETVALVQIDATGVAMDFRIQANDAQDPIHDLRLLTAITVRRRRRFAISFWTEPVRLALSASDELLADERLRSVTSWSQRREPNEISNWLYRAKLEGGVAWELLVAMANEAAINPWINVPHLGEQ